MTKKRILELLQPFAGGQHPRPWIADGFAYASDRIIVCRAPCKCRDTKEQHLDGAWVFARYKVPATAKWLPAPPQEIPVKYMIPISSLAVQTKRPVEYADQIIRMAGPREKISECGPWLKVGVLHFRVGIFEGALCVPVEEQENG